MLIERGGGTRRAGEAPPLELYNLRTDLTQTNNLASTNPERMAELAARLRQLGEQGFTRPAAKRSSD